MKVQQRIIGIRAQTTKLNTGQNRKLGQTSNELKGLNSELLILISFGHSSLHGNDKTTGVSKISCWVQKISHSVVFFRLVS